MPNTINTFQICSLIIYLFNSTSNRHTRFYYSIQTLWRAFLAQNFRKGHLHGSDERVFHNEWFHARLVQGVVPNIGSFNQLSILLLLVKFGCLYRFCICFFLLLHVHSGLIILENLVSWNQRVQVRFFHRFAGD